MTEVELRSAANALRSARECSRGEIGAIEACWVLSSFAFDRNQFLSREDANLFVGIQSETDALPVGSLKENWHSDFLPDKVENMKSYEVAVSKKVQDACAQLIATLEAAGVASR